MNHYLTGDIESRYLNIESLNTASKFISLSLGHLYKSAYTSMLDTNNTVEQDAPTSHEGYAADGIGFYSTTFRQVGEEWKPRYTLLILHYRNF